MEINIFNNNEVPQSKDKIRIEDVVVTPYPDRFRVHVQVKVTPFRDRPNLLLVVHNEVDRIVSELNVIETLHFNMEFTMHLRNITDPTGAYTLTVELFYESRNPPQDSKIEGFVIPPAADESAQS